MYVDFTSKNDVTNKNSDFDDLDNKTNQRFLRVLSKDDKVRLINSMKNIGGMVKDTAVSSRLNLKRVRKSNHCTGDSSINRKL